MKRLLMMAARILGPILLTRLMRRRKTKRALPDEEKFNPRIDNKPENVGED